MSNFASLDSLKKKKEEEEKKGDGLYVGGTDGRGGGSGLNVINPGDADGKSGDPMQDVFQRARAAGSKDLPDDTMSKKIITIYRNGFTIDEGEFRSLNDPKNAEFVADMGKGTVPRELEESSNGKPVHVQLEDKRTEDYILPAYVAFSGSGQSLGSPGADVAAAAEAAQTAAQVSDLSPPVADTSQPTTAIQIRLPDGRRVRSTLNLTHLVGHIHAVVRQEMGTTGGSGGGGGDGAYQLIAGFPPKPLSDPTVSIKDAQLQGASITVKKI